MDFLAENSEIASRATRSRATSYGTARLRLNLAFNYYY